MGFLITLKKSIGISPTQKIVLLGLIINSLDKTLSLTVEELDKFQKQCLSLIPKKTTSLLELAKAIGLLSSTIQCSYLCAVTFSISPITTNFNDKKGMSYQSQ